MPQNEEDEGFRFPPPGAIVGPLITILLIILILKLLGVPMNI